MPGSNASDSTEIYAEGLRIPPLKLYERGKPNTTLFRMIDRNVRVPGRVLGDIRSQLAACEIAARGMADLVARYGADGVVALMAATMDYSERLTRHCLAELPDGEATFTDWIDDDQIDVGVPIPLVCTVRKHGDTMEVDWTGSAPQVKGAINNTWSYTAAMSFTAVKSVLSINMPNNDGVFRPIKVIAPPGTITQRQAAGGVCGARADRVPRRRLLLWRAGATLSRSGVRGVGRRQHRHHHRRLRQGTATVHLCGFPVRVLGRRGLGRTGLMATPACSPTWRVFRSR